jgi:myo-inositol-1(or 4)-monophosphatase
MTGLRDDLNLMEQAARAAGAIIAAGFGTVVETWSKGAAGPVTEIDLAANEAIRAILGPGRPDYGWLSEETPDDPARLSRTRVFIVDPLDGTQAFLQHVPECTVSIGLSQDGKAVAGVVFNPITDELFKGAAGLGATLNGDPIHVSDRDALAGATLLGKPEWFTAPHWKRPWPPVTGLFKHSIAYRLSLVAQGLADGGALLGYKHDWDIAAGCAIVEAAGGIITDPWGQPHAFNAVDARAPGIVAAGPRLHPLLCAQVSLTPHPREWGPSPAPRPKDAKP